MSDKSDAFGIIKTCFGKYPPNGVTPDDYGLARWQDIEFLSGEEVRYLTQQLVWISEGYPLRHRCTYLGHNSNSIATDIFHETRRGGKPVVFWCRWCKKFWHTPDATAGRIQEVKETLGLEGKSEVEKVHEKSGILSRFFGSGDD